MVGMFFSRNDKKWNVPTLFFTIDGPWWISRKDLAPNEFSNTFLRDSQLYNTAIAIPVILNIFCEQMPQSFVHLELPTTIVQASYQMTGSRPFTMAGFIKLLRRLWCFFRRETSHYPSNSEAFLYKLFLGRGVCVYSAILYYYSDIRTHTQFIIISRFYSRATTDSHTHHQTSWH